LDTWKVVVLHADSDDFRDVKIVERHSEASSAVEKRKKKKEFASRTVHPLERKAVHSTDTERHISLGIFVRTQFPPFPFTSHRDSPDAPTDNGGVPPNIPPSSVPGLQPQEEWHRRKLLGLHTVLLYSIKLVVLYVRGTRARGRHRRGDQSRAQIGGICGGSLRTELS
jgi:hypothetical protein